MGIIAGIVILLLLFSVAAKKPKTYRPIRPEIYRSQIRQGHWETRIIGYELKKNYFYGFMKRQGYSDHKLDLMGFQEYTIEPQYGPVWVPE